MKDQLKHVIVGVAGQLAYSDTLKLSDSEKNDMLNPELWEYKGCSSALIVLQEMHHLFEYTKQFIQIKLTVKNNVVVSIDVITDKTKEITFD